jgi:hypothetical protein
MCNSYRAQVIASILHARTRHILNQLYFCFDVRLLITLHLPGKVFRVYMISPFPVLLDVFKYKAHGVCVIVRMWMYMRCGIALSA